jgi:hypothetical protein
MKKMLSLTVLILLIVALANACKKDSENKDTGTVDCSSITTTYSGTVNPLISTSCAKSGCHDATSTNGPGALTNYTQVFNARAQIRTAVSTGTMPRDATFTASQKASITCWIDAGAPNN